MDGSFENWDDHYYNKNLFKELKKRAKANTAPKPSPGRCCFHLTEFETCANQDQNLFATIKMVDTNKNTVYQNDTQNSVNDKSPWVLKAPFGGSDLRIAGEHSGTASHKTMAGFIDF